MVLKVPEMGAWFKVVTPGVGDDTMLQDMELAHAPSVETLFRVEAIEYGLIADLNITNSSSDASNVGPFWDRPQVGGVGNPSYRRVPRAVDAGDMDLLELGKAIFSIRG